jgi:hypothetical protein
MLDKGLMVESIFICENLSLDELQGGGCTKVEGIKQNHRHVLQSHGDSVELVVGWDIKVKQIEELEG